MRRRLPTVEPTAQHRVAFTQSSALRELTGVGRPTAVNLPSHGESTANVEGGAVVAELAQALRVRPTASATTAAHGRARRRRKSVHGSEPGIQRTLMTSVWATLSWNPCRRLSHNGDRAATIV